MTSTSEDTGPSDALVRAAMASPKGTPKDKLDALRALCESLRDQELLIEDLEQRLEEAKALRQTLRVETIPDKMDECQVGAIDLLPRGNLPAVRVEVRPFVSANIAAKWEDDRRRAGFDYLDSCGAGDLIKTTIAIYFPREKRADALELQKKLREAKLDVEVNETVNNNTLSAWLREVIKKKGPPPAADLEKIGGHVGRVAEVAGVKKK